MIDPEVVARLLGRPRGDPRSTSTTPREQEILSLMAEGRSNQAIADRLSLELERSRPRPGDLLEAGLEPAAEDHRRVLAVLAYLRS